MSPREKKMKPSGISTRLTLFLSYLRVHAHVFLVVEELVVEERDKTQETRDERRETRDKRQETRDKRREGKGV